MDKARFRVMAGLAGATLCLFAVTSYAQTPATTGTAGTDASAQTTPAPTTTPTDQATTPAATDQGITTTTTTTETWSFPGGTLGILAVAVLVLLVLFALFRGRDRTTVVKETYTANPPVTRSSGIGTADDRNINSRAASGTGTNPGGMNDPDARR
jgi:hypothetical protein